MSLRDEAHRTPVCIVVRCLFLLATSTPSTRTGRFDRLAKRQGLDATHSDELFPIKGQCIGINSGVRRGARDGPKNLPSHVGTARRF
jgi:hypothetical protein